MPSQTTPRLPPRRDSLDDEQALARTDVADPPRFSPRGLEARRDREPLLQAGLRRTQLLHLGALCGKRVPRLEVRGERPVVEVDGETDRGDDPDEAHSPTRAQPGSPLRLSNPRVPLCALAHAAGFHPAARSPPAPRRVAFLSRLGRRWQRRRGRGPQGSTGGTSKARGRSILPPAASAQPGGGLCPRKGYAARRVAFLSRLGRRWQRRRGRGPQGSTGGTSKARGRSILPPAAS